MRSTTLTHPAYAGAYVYGKTRQRAVRGRRPGPCTSGGAGSAGRLGGAHPRAPRGIPRLGHLSGQPGTHRREHPPGRARRRRPARSGRAARCCRAWRSAGSAAASSPSTTTGGTNPPPATTAPAPASWSTARVCGTCGSAASASTPRSPRRSWPRWPGRAAGLPGRGPQLENGHDSALEQYRREVERARYDATKAERRYLAVDAENRLVARGLEAAWEKALTALAAAEAELARREAQHPKTLTAQENTAILALGDELESCGQRRPPPTGTARNCSAPCSTRSPSASTGPPSTPT